MIMAAGMGKRMLPLTKSLPKPMLKIHGKSLIEYHIDALQRAGISEIVINVSYLGEIIEAALGNGQERGLDIQYSREPVPLETAGGIRNALPLLQGLAGLNQAFLVVGGDVYTDFDFRELAEYQCSADAHLIMVDNPTHHPEGDFAISEGGFLESRGKLLTYSTIALYRPSFFCGLRDGPVMLRELFDLNLDNRQITAEYFSGGWSDVGTPNRLDLLNQ
jgi:MurNAc alpha-1-phosphate uridylyltransferase